MSRSPASFDERAIESYIAAKRRIRRLMRRGYARGRRAAALSVPLLVRRADRVLGGRREAEALGEPARKRRARLDHPVEVTPPGDRELEPDAEPMERRIAAADQAHRRGRRPRAADVVVVLRRTQRDVVSEPLRLLVCVGMAADVDEERRVVDGRALVLLEVEPVGHARETSVLQ